MPNLANYIKHFWSDKNSRLILGGLAMTVLLAIIVGFQKESSQTRESQTTSQQRTADTYIPDGYVLIPIELSNFESVSGLVGEFALVDLFLGRNGFRKTGEKIGTRLKMIRAPLNPQQFAVLVLEGESHKILEHEGPFVATVLNPSIREKSLLNTKPKIRRNVEYFN